MSRLHSLTERKINLGSRTYKFYHLPSLSDAGFLDPSRFPRSIRILLEAALRNFDNEIITERDLDAILSPVPSGKEIAFKPGRVVLQDFTGVPAVVDLAALRSAIHRMGGDPGKINPLVKVDLVVDHSVQVDYFGSNDALQKNLEKEFERNKERYQFLKWGQKAFKNFGIVPPGTGIVHQVNLEYLGRLVLQDGDLIYPDSLVGTDSHTTMINGLGILGWGVGGIEAEAAMLGQPYYMLVPEVVGFRLTGSLPEGSTATDLVLLITQMLRQKNVVGKFVEFYGNGLDSLSLPDRATIANMAPEYGATMGYFPVDREVLRYMELTGRDPELLALVERYYKEQNLFRTSDRDDPEYKDFLELDLGDVKPSIAGPKRPQDRIELTDVPSSWRQLLGAPVNEGGYGLTHEKQELIVSVKDSDFNLRQGDVVIAAITSCTNTSNPGVLIAAGLLAKKAVEMGLKRKSWVKSSLAPGSRVVTDYLDRSGLSEFLNTLGFQTVGYGCTTCIGNSGPLPDPIARAIEESDLVAASVLSGNRNFEGRINSHVRANFLASPPLVLAYAIAGNMDIDFETEPLNRDNPDEKPVYLKDIWPTSVEIRSAILEFIKPEMYRARYSAVYESTGIWEDLALPDSMLYVWEDSSTYIREPDFFQDLPREAPALKDIKGARVLAKLGDSVTTDHISPAGSIPYDSPAGRYLVNAGVERKDFNSYGSRRGNHEVMTRGTFGNIRLKNQLAPGTEGGITRYLPDGEQMDIYDAAVKYQKNQVPLIVIAGKEYGTGSSRDWAAKGTQLLGVRAVIASSYERIHRSNLIGMGVLPLQFLPDQDARSLNLSGEEVYTITGIESGLAPGSTLQIRADDKKFQVLCRLDTQVELTYYQNGGILQYMLRRFLNE